MGDYNILDFGAVTGEEINNAAAIQAAIDECRLAGGRVIVPAGRFISGTIYLKDHVELYLESGAWLVAALKEEWMEGCFIGACHCKDVTISGQGTIYGQGDKIFYDDGADNGYGECPLNIRGYRPRTTYLEDVTNLTIRDVTFRNAAFWTLHMAGCKHVTIRDIKILNDVRGANNDGIDPDCCQDVTISGCLIKTGDDAIVVKATKAATEKYGVCENIIIQNCILYSHDSGLKIGTETHGTIRNIVMSDCIIQDCSRGVGIWVRDGGTVENVHIHHVMGSTRRYADCPQREFAPRWWGKGEPLFFNAAYRNEHKKYPGKIRNITADHIWFTSESCIFAAGEEEGSIENITISNLNLTLKQQGSQPAQVFDEQPSPRGVYDHEIPVVYSRWVKGLSVEGTLTYDNLDKRQTIIQENSSDININMKEQ